MHELSNLPQVISILDIKCVIFDDVQNQSLVFRLVCYYFYAFHYVLILQDFLSIFYARLDILKEEKTLAGGGVVGITNFWLF